MTKQSEPTIYRIVVVGELDQGLSDWFDDMVITHDEDGNSVIVGPVVDQAALHGILLKIRDMNLPLIALAQVEGPANTSVSQNGGLS
jgi:hypothetical protein